MPRIPYIPHDSARTDNPELFTSILARRGGRLLNLDRMLLHSPSFAKGWNGFLNEVRCGLSVAPHLRELAICGVAVLNGAEYEFQHHAPEFLRAGGTPDQLESLRDFETAADNTTVFNEVERAVIRLTIEMTRTVHVSDAAFLAVRAAIPDDREIVELVGVIATYNMVSRFLVALRVELE